MAETKAPAPQPQAGETLQWQMRVQRVSLSDSGNQDIREFNLVNTDRNGAPLQPGLVTASNIYAHVTDDFVGDLKHDDLVTVAIYPPAPLSK